MNYFNKFEHFCRRSNKRIIFGIPIGFGCFLIMRRFHLIQRIKYNLIQKRINALNENCELNKEVESFFIKVLSSDKVKTSIINNIGYIVSNKEINEDLKESVSNLMISALNDAVFINNIKLNLMEISKNEKISFLNNQFYKYITENYSTEEVDNFIRSVLLEEKLFKMICNEMFNCCKMGVNDQKVEKQTIELIKEVLSDEKFLKEIYMRVFDIFSKYQTHPKNIKH